MRQFMLGMVLLVAGTSAWCEPVEVSAELERLRERYGFEIQGLEQTLEARGRTEGESALARLRLLLEDFDHVIVQGGDGGIERLIILGERQPYVPPAVVRAPQDDHTPKSGDTITLKTRTQGASHTVIVELEGARGRRVRQMLLVDTGADLVVLPESLRLMLGIEKDALNESQVQTANGMVEAHTGILPAIWLGEYRLADVKVAFIEDKPLASRSLLGMSLLGRFRMTIDDDERQLQLITK